MEHKRLEVIILGSKQLGEDERWYALAINDTVLQGSYIRNMINPKVSILLCLIAYLKDESFVTSFTGLSDDPHKEDSRQCITLVEDVLGRDKDFK